jgi:hypothetical protein
LAGQDEPPGGPPGPENQRFGISGLIGSAIVIGAAIVVGIPQAIIRFATELVRAALR